MDRYARQEMIAGWDQSRLTETTLLVTGSGWLARMTGLLAAAMGFGHIVLMGNEQVMETDRRFLPEDARAGASLMRTWSEVLEAVNGEVCVDYVHDLPCQRSFKRVPKPDVVIEASPDLFWKRRGCGFAFHTEADLILAAAGPQVGIYRAGGAICKNMARFDGVREDPLVSLALAALVVEEARRLRMRLDNGDGSASGQVLVSPEALHRQAGGKPTEIARTALGGHRVSLVGAGALGTWAGIGLGLAGGGPLEMTVYDPDRIEGTNLNRQVLFGGALYKSKAEVLSKRLSALFPRVKAEGRVEAATEENLEAVCGADLVISGPDTLAARALLNRGARLWRTPLVNGGTSVFGADVTAYVPDVSPCLECSLRVETASNGVSERRARCGRVQEASVVTSNALAGALMAFEARAALSRRPARGVIGYDGRAQKRRLGVRSVQGPCTCHLEGVLNLKQ